MPYIGKWVDENIELVVTVKASPAVSRRLGEVVCVAGIRTDLEPHRWIRLFPIAFRDLDFSRRFRKYQVISLRGSRAKNDARPESMRPNTDSLQPGRQIRTNKAWAERRALIEPLMIDSMCELQRRQVLDHTSLGVFRPAEVENFTVDAAPPWDPDQQAKAAQPSLLMPTKAGLEWIPYRFRYRYRCADPKCGGHHQSIVDWELSEAYRDWSRQYGDEVFDRLRQKWLGQMCGPDRDTAFYVGNQHQHPDGFLVLGVFWPPKA